MGVGGVRGYREGSGGGDVWDFQEIGVWEKCG